MKAGLSAVFLALFIGCTSSVQVTDRPVPDTIVAPADSGFGYLYGPETSVVRNPNCDSLLVAQEILNRAMRDVVGQAELYRLEIDGELEGRGKTIDSLGRKVDYYRAKLSARVNEPPKPFKVPQEYLDKQDALLKENADLKANQERHGLLWFIGYTVAVLAVAGILLFLYSAIRNIIPGIKF